MTGCDDERQRIAREIQASVIRFEPTPERRTQDDAKQEAYRQRRRAWREARPPYESSRDSRAEEAPGEAKPVTPLIL